jgi:hypothetical protein
LLFIGRLFGGLAATAKRLFNFTPHFPSPWSPRQTTGDEWRPIVPDLPELGIIRIFIDEIVDTKYPANPKRKQG